MLGALYRYLREADPRALPADERELRPRRRLADAREGQAREARDARRARARGHGASGATRTLRAPTQPRRERHARPSDAERTVGAAAATSTTTSTISRRSATSRRTPSRAYERDLREFVAFLGSYYGGGAWSWQGVDRLAMRGFLGALDAARRRQAHRWRARCRRCAASIAGCIATRSSTRIRRARSARRSSRSICPAISTARRSTCSFRWPRRARMEGRVHRRAQPRDPRAVLLDGHAPVRAAGAEPRRPRSRVASR